MKNKLFLLIALIISTMLLLVCCNNSQGTAGTTESSDTTSIVTASEITPDEIQSQSETSSSTETVENNSVSYDTDSVKPNVEPTETVESQSSPNNTVDTESTTNTQEYIGTWDSDGEHGYITITDIADEYISFTAGVYKQFDFSVKAVKQDDIYVFGTDTSPLLSGPPWVKGNVKIGPDFVSVTYTDLPSPWEGLNRELKYFNKSSTETQPNVEQPTETQSKTYICTAEMFTKDGFLTQPECIPALTLNDDGTMIFRVYYIGGVTDVPGTYVIEDNKIYIYCVLEGTPVYGFYSDGMAWMDDKFMFEIVDEDTLTIHAHPDDTGSFRCYTVEPGDPFVRR